MLAVVFFASRRPQGSLVSRLTPPLRRGAGKVDLQLPSVDDLGGKDFLRPLRAGYIDEVGMSESSWLPGTAINRYTHVQDVTNLAE